VELEETWLDEEQALLVCMRSDAPRAIEVRRVIVKIFRAAVRQLDANLQRQSNLWRRVQDFLLASRPTEWERCFQPSLVRALCALDGLPWDGGRHPRHLASTNRKIYDTVFSTQVGRALKERNPEPRHGSNHSQELSPDARAYFVEQLRIVEAIAQQSATKGDFWARLEREYGGGMLQMPTHLGGGL
jgi:hypothetical protein